MPSDDEAAGVQAMVFSTGLAHVLVTKGIITKEELLQSLSGFTSGLPAGVGTIMFASFTSSIEKWKS